MNLIHLFISSFSIVAAFPHYQEDAGKVCFKGERITYLVDEFDVDAVERKEAGKGKAVKATRC